MRIPTLIFCTAILAAGAAFGAPGDGPRSFLTPEQREMYREQQPRGDWHQMSDDQRQAMREQMRAKWDAMSDQDKQRLRAELQAKWDSMSPAQKQALEQKIAEREQRREQNGQQRQ